MERVSNRSNADDLESQWYYRWLRDTYPFHVAAQLAVLFLVSNELGHGVGLRKSCGKYQHNGIRCWMDVG